MSKTIKVRLDPQGIANAIKELEEYKRDVERKVRLLVTKLAERGADIARAKLIQYDALSTSELLNSINHEVKSNNTSVIFVRSNYAVYVEFGTGPVGAKQQHPSGKGKYRSKGWYTAADGKPMNELYGWTPIIADDGNIIYFTLGQSSKSFMHDTAMQLREEVLLTAKEVWG